MSENRIIGRDYEQHILQNICEEEEARLVAVYGRRRVGKTYLVKYFFKEKFDFFFTGSFETPMKVQMSLFRAALSQYSGQPCPALKNWFDAFAQGIPARLEEKAGRRLSRRTPVDGHAAFELPGRLHLLLEHMGFNPRRTETDSLRLSHFVDA